MNNRTEGSVGWIGWKQKHTEESVMDPLTKAPIPDNSVDLVYHLPKWEGKKKYWSTR